MRVGLTGTSGRLYGLSRDVSAPLTWHHSEFYILLNHRSGKNCLGAQKLIKSKKPSSNKLTLSNYTISTSIKRKVLTKSQINSGWDFHQNKPADTNV
jgi:hypothetical protein